MKEAQKTVYIAEDGREFISEQECEKYEKDCKDILRHIRFFTLDDHPDLTETGLMQRRRHVAVLDDNYEGHALLLQFALDENGGKCLGTGVMGCGKRSTFEISTSSREEFLAAEGISWGGRSHKAERLVIADRDLEFFRNFGEYRFIPTDSIWKV